VEREEFWRLTEKTRPRDNNTRQHAQILTETLALLDPSEILSFASHSYQFHLEAYRCDLWSAIYEIDGGCGDDSFMDFRAWLIAQGQDVFETVLADPEYLGEIMGRGCFMFCEPFGSVAERAYHQRTGNDIPRDWFSEVLGQGPLHPRGRFIRKERSFRQRFPMLWWLLHKPPEIDPSWLTWQGGKVVAAAQSIHEGRRWTELPILADALEDAGCRDAFLLEHCRAGSRHARSCWVTNFLLGKK